MGAKDKKTKRFGEKRDFWGGGNTKLCGLWDYAHYEKKDTLSLP